MFFFMQNDSTLPCFLPSLQIRCWETLSDSSSVEAFNQKCKTIKLSENKSKSRREMQSLKTSNNPSLLVSQAIKQNHKKIARDERKYMEHVWRRCKVMGERSRQQRQQAMNTAGMSISGQCASDKKAWCSKQRHHAPLFKPFCVQRI